MLTLYKNLIKAGAKSDHSVKVLTMLSSIYCKIATFSSKCRDYIVRKGGIHMICSILNNNSNYLREEQLIFKSLYALGALAGDNDQQLLV